MKSRAIGAVLGLAVFVIPYFAMRSTLSNFDPRAFAWYNWLTYYFLRAIWNASGVNPDRGPDAVAIFTVTSQLSMLIPLIAAISLYWAVQRRRRPIASSKLL
jgi:hypothetical protein